MSINNRKPKSNRAKGVIAANERLRKALCTAENAQLIHAKSAGRLTVDWAKWELHKGLRQYEYRCVCGTPFFANTAAALKGYAACPTCGSNVSRGEREVGEYIESLGFDIQRSCRTLITPKELDIVVPAVKLAVEFNGVYHHSRPDLAPTAHAEKRVQTEALGYRLIQISEDDWELHRPAVQAILRNACGCEPRSGAREYKVARVSSAEARAFLAAHHVQGAPHSAAIAYGLLDREGGLRAVMTFSRPASARRAYRDGTYELHRFAADHGINGAASRLWSAFRRDFSPVGVVTYADHRYFTGAIYETLGFRPTAFKVDYAYVYGSKVYAKASFQKSAIKAKYPDLYDPAKTEAEMAAEIGLRRIWNAGRTTYTWGSMTAADAEDGRVLKEATVARLVKMRKASTTARRRAAAKGRWDADARAAQGAQLKARIASGAMDGVIANLASEATRKGALAARDAADRARHSVDWWHPEHGHRRAWAKDMATEFGNGKTAPWNLVKAGHRKTYKGWQLGTGPDYDDLTGRAFGHLLVTGMAPAARGRKNGEAWTCECACGDVRVYPRSVLVTGGYRSCGCRGD